MAKKDYLKQSKKENQFSEKNREIIGELPILLFPLLQNLHNVLCCCRKRTKKGSKRNAFELFFSFLPFLLTMKIILFGSKDLFFVLHSFSLPFNVQRWMMNEFNNKFIKNRHYYNKESLIQRIDSIAALRITKDLLLLLLVLVLQLLLLLSLQSLSFLRRRFALLLLLLGFILISLGNDGR